MAITTIMPPTVQEFRDAFPEFAGATDGQIQMALDTAMTWIDVWWFWPDAKLAVMYAAAHYLYLHDKASGGMITGGGGAGGGTPPVIDSEAGLIWVKTVRFRDRMVTYDRVSGAADAGGSEKKKPSRHRPRNSGIPHPTARCICRFFGATFHMWR